MITKAIAGGSFVPPAPFRVEKGNTTEIQVQFKVIDC